MDDRRRRTRPHRCARGGRSRARCEGPRSSRTTARPCSGGASSAPPRWAPRSMRSRRALFLSVTRSRSSTSHRCSSRSSRPSCCASGRARRSASRCSSRSAASSSSSHPSFSWQGAPPSSGPSAATTAAVAVSAAFFASIAMMMLRRVGKTENPEAIAVHFSVFAAVVMMGSVALRSAPADVARCGLHGRRGSLRRLRSARPDARVHPRARRAGERHGLPRRRRERAPRCARPRRAPERSARSPEWRSS